MRSGEWKGHTGKRIRNVVNIGIGGSDLGPVMAYEALKHYSDREYDVPVCLECGWDGFCRGSDRSGSGGDAVYCFVEDLYDTGDDYQCTVSARLVLKGLGGDENAVAKHFVAVSTNAEGVRSSGSIREHVWILGLGGRALFDGLGDWAGDDAGDWAGELPAMLDGFHQMDEHFRTAPFEKNLPVLLGLLGVWYADFLVRRRWLCCPMSSI